MIFGPKLQARLDAIEGRRDVQNLAVVTCYYNPCNYRRIRANYDHFAAALGQPLHTIEMALDDDDFQLPDGPRMHRVRGSRARNLLWQKERLLNLLISRLPAEYDAVAWIDADILFFDPGWYDRAKEALHRWPVAQLFGRIYDTDDRGRTSRASPSYGLVQHDRRLRGQYGRPGGAWAARREIISGGLYDLHVIGGSDAAMVASWMGQPSITPAIDERTAWGYSWVQWSRSQFQRVQGRIGVVPGDCVHLYHGSRENRRYVERYAVLHDHDFNPETDVETDAAGLLAWSDHALRCKPDMVQAVAEYFPSRREDD